MPKLYSLEQAIPEVMKMLAVKGLDTVRCSNLDSGYQLTASNGLKTARIRVRHLQYDENYKDSLLPYPVYKIKAFPNGKHDNHTLRDVDFVVGYNPSEGSFACVPDYVFRNQGLACIHQKEGLRHEYYNSWAELDSFMTAPNGTKSILESREGYVPNTGSDYDFHRDAMEEDDSVERLLIMLEHGTVSDEIKKQIIQRFRTSYPQVDKWLNQRSKDKPNDEWNKQFDI
ncbi:hypothetical protein [Brevibacillus brevis]|uniref:hypothetical protein n=1 Tax=Brevibacillus brevis TaxID=1393 RepID=UPI0037CC175F